MKVRVALLLSLIALGASSVSAGDVGSFVNLGFSTDSSTFMFGLYGVRDKDSTPYAETYIVDVAGNKFVQDGQVVISGAQTVTLGQDGSGAFYNALHRAQAQIVRYHVDHLNLGRLVYVLVNGQTSKSTLTFRDFNTGNKYDVELIQAARPLKTASTGIVSPTPSAGTAPASVPSEASFHIKVTATAKNGEVKTITLGRQNYFRTNVNEYQIRQVILSPDEKSLVFVIEKLDRGAEALNTSYMVETVKLF